MTKPPKAKAPAKPKAGTPQKRKAQGNPMLAMLQNMDPEMLVMMRQLIENELGPDDDIFERRDPIALFKTFLKNCGDDRIPDDANSDLMELLGSELDDLRIDANGGSGKAREKMKAIYDLLDEAIDDGALNPIGLMMIGKMLSDAGWAIPDSLKQTVAKSLEAGGPGMQGGGGSDFLAPLLDLVDQTDQNPFDIHAHVQSILAGFPPDASAMLLAEILSRGNPLINQALAGFVLHPDPHIAETAAAGLAHAARQDAVESLLAERLVRMRPWLPEARLARIDDAIRVMRSNALPPVKLEAPTLIKFLVSVCDGSGTRSIFVTQRFGTRYQIATVMIKPYGVAEAMMLSDLPKRDMDDITRQMKSSVLSVESNLAGVTRMLALGLADNLATNTLPPFKLIAVVESLGLAAVHPDRASPLDIIEALLLGLPPAQTDAAAVAKAHTEILDTDFKYQWFEAGEDVEDVLLPVKGTKQRAAKLLKTYLPERRHFWARQCAITALAIHDGEKPGRLPWKQLALVGRALATGVPLDEIPLMRQVADISVRAFEGRL